MAVIETRSRRVVDSEMKARPKSVSAVWIWLAALSLAVGWLGIVPIYSPPHWSAVVFFAAAVLSFAVFFRHTDIAPLPKRYLAFLFPLIVSIFFIPWPYNLGSVLLLCGLVIITAGERMPIFRRLALALGICGIAMLLESAVQPVFFQVFAHYHGLPWAAAVIPFILNGVGAKVSASGSILYQQTFEALLPINVTAEALGLYAVASFVTIGTALLFILRAGPWRWLALLAISIVYALIRYPVLLLIYEECGQMDLFWSTWVTMFTFVPLAVIIGRFVTRGLPAPESMKWPEPEFGRASVAMLLASCVATICIIGVFSFQDPGTVKRGRILIDEGHSNWEWTTRKYDTQWYNQASGYNYYCMAYYLAHFYDVARSDGRITRELLQHCDVLVLKTLTKPLQEDEIDAIVDFVRAGGGVWLVGDHTNVFGISARINPLAQHFGMSYKYDATYDLSNGGLTIYRPSVMLPHPTVQYMPPVFLFGTSDSMDASLWADYPVIGYSLRSLKGDYARENFFPENRPTLDQEFGLLPQEVAVEYGHGRVAAWTDSTVFSNFWFYMPGKSELCLGTINWLNHANRWGFIRWLLAIVVLVCALYLGIRWSRGRNSGAILVWVLAGALLGVPIGTGALGALNRSAYRPPAARCPLPRIAFEREHCNFTLPSESLDSSMALENHYHTFFVWTQRLGYMPASVPSLDVSMASSELVVLVNPNKDFTPEELLSLKRYMQAGGRVLLLDNAYNQDSTANRLLSDYGVRIEDRPFRQSWIFDRQGRKIAAADFPRPITGGEPVLSIALHKPFVTVVHVGKGLIAAMGSSQIFTDRTMGVTSTVPNGYQSGIYEIEFWLFRNLMDGPPDPKQWDLPRLMLDAPQHDSNPKKAIARKRG